MGDSGRLYLFGGKEKRPTFGFYPEVTLAEARDRRDKALCDNRDPVAEERRCATAEIAAVGATFETIAPQWHEDAPPNAVWRIPADRMKLEVQDKGDEAFGYDVPLPLYAVATLASCAC